MIVVPIRTDFLSDPACCGTKEAANVVDSCDSPQEGRVLVTAEVVDLEEVRRHNDTAEHSLIVAEELNDANAAIFKV